MTAHEMRIELTRLMSERHQAAVCGLADNAVTEVATVRAELPGPQRG